MTWTRERANSWAHEYYLANRDAIRRRQRNYRAMRRDELAAAARAYRARRVDAAQREVEAARHRAYHAAHRNEVNTRHRIRDLVGSDASPLMRNVARRLDELNQLIRSTRDGVSA